MVLKTTILGRTISTPTRRRTRSAEVASAVLTQLENEPDDIDAWRALLKHCNQSGPRVVVPGALMGSVDGVADAELCLVKGHILVCCGKPAEAREWLRTAPQLAVTRQHAFDISCRGSPLDPEFCRYIAGGDKFRDEGQWDHAEYHYWRAVQLYPHHAGYLVQYAHSIKEQHKYVPAEIWYRSALAYAVHRTVAQRHGVAIRDILEHLGNATAELRYDEPEGNDPAVMPADPGDCLLLDERPTKLDVIYAHELLLGQQPDDDRVLGIMRTHKTIAEMFQALIGQLDFMHANRDLLSIYGRRAK